MSEVITQLHFFMAHSAASMTETTNWHCHNIAIIKGERVWLSTEHLKIPPPLSCQLAACFVGPYPVLCIIGPVSFQLWILDVLAIHIVFYPSQPKPAIGLFDDFSTLFCPEADDSVELKLQTFQIPIQSTFETKLLSNFLSIGRAILCLKVLGSLLTI